MNDIPIRPLKKGVKTKRYRAVDKIRDKEYVSQALWQCIVANDTDSFKEILRTHLELTNKEEIIRKTGLSRRTLYRMLSEEGNPTLENISLIVHQLCA